MAIKRKENFNTPKNTPTPNTFQTDVLGKGIKNTAGMATIKKRKDEKRIGGNSSNPNLITEKLRPQINTTNNANEILFKFTPTPSNILS